MNRMHKYALSVIVPTYNRRTLLEYTIHSILNQDIPTDDFEVIVVDDGSDDDTRELLDSYSDLLNLKYQYQPDLGYRPGSARNLGIMRAEGKVCLFVDSGVILNKQCLRAHILMHSQKTSRVAVLGYVYG